MPPRGSCFQTADFHSKIIELRLRAASAPPPGRIPLSRQVIDRAGTGHKQVRVDAGIHAVVATTSAIQDGVAAEFAAAFYAELATRSLREAYETAMQAVQLRSGDDPRSVIRDVEGVGDTEPPPWPGSSIAPQVRGLDAGIGASAPVSPRKQYRAPAG